MRVHSNPYRGLKRCLYLFTVISLLPLAVIYLFTNEQFYKIRTYNVYLNDTQVPAAVADQKYTTQGLSKKEYQEIELRMQNRLERLAAVCSKFGLDQSGDDHLHKPNPWEFLVSKKYHLIWCNVFKAASTSWMYNFNLMAGYTPQFLKKTNQVPLVLARKKYPRPSAEELELAQNTSVSFLIVRHPFERLLSAYKDKIQYALPNSMHHKLGLKIVQRYRKKNYKGKRTSWPTFSEFVDYLIDEINVNNKDMDMHWTPITSFCTPCQVKFDVIAKFETLAEDQRYLIEKANLTNVISPQWKNSGKEGITKQLASSSFKELTFDQIRILHKFYKYDFELFDYSADDYYSVSLPDDSLQEHESKDGDKPREAEAA